MVVVQLLKTLAIPLIFFAILDALIRTSLPLSQGTRLLVICLVNVTVAMTIGLVIMNTWQPGLSWQGHVDQLLQFVPGSKGPAKGGDPRKRRLKIWPRISLARSCHRSPRTTSSASCYWRWCWVQACAVCIMRAARTGRMIMPSCVLSNGSTNGSCASLAGSFIWCAGGVRCGGAGGRQVGRGRLFRALDLSRGHACRTDHPLLIYYPLVVWFVGKKSPKVYVGEGADAIATGHVVQQ